MTTRRLALGAALLLATTPAFAAFQLLPTTPLPPTPVGQRSGFQNQNTDLLLGLRIQEPAAFVPDPGGASKFRYPFPTGYTLLAQTQQNIVFQGTVVGVLYDYVFRDTADNQLVFGARTLLQQTVGGVQNTFEINDFFRRGFTGYTAVAAWQRLGDADLRMYRALRSNTNTTFSSPGNPIVNETFDADVVKFNSDINVSEGNPDSALFLAKTSAPAYATQAGGFRLRQAGEEGQLQTDVIFTAFVPSAQTPPAPVRVPLLGLAGLLGTFAALTAIAARAARRRS